MQHRLGEKYYLWKKQQSNSECIIFSHGAQTARTEYFLVPSNVELHFYCADGLSMEIQSSSFAEFLKEGFKVPYEIFKPGSLCRNYRLTKVQGYHFHPMAGYFGVLAKPAIQYSMRRGRVIPPAGDYSSIIYDYKKISNDSAYVRETPDLITVRHRVGATATSLEELLRQPLLQQLQYKKFYCFFCRDFSSLSCWQNQVVPILENSGPIIHSE